ncbi:hypothetical protein HELRODRAFT_172979 [Helobdella robusta]|uniref:Uncharacterized protein n=1 Tax=Helobdella robusta TaxID=6412 RepID=T1F686_HELRO|nr:hypothetical protein HELRODRAFT_172979 [Helobdella robusta]ESO03944.1 hypothetical protein HELRODRAFT_172979 [Helobdella robusta]
MSSEEELSGLIEDINKGTRKNTITSNKRSKQQLEWHTFKVDDLNWYVSCTHDPTRSTYQCAKKTRLTRLLKQAFLGLPVEGRGGDRVSHKSISKELQIRTFIKSLRARESHYERNKSIRVYLPAELKSSRQLWRMYNSTTSSFQMFYKIFTREFNIGFGSPKVDACTTCERFRHLIRKHRNEHERKKLVAERKVHLLRKNAFYKALRTEVNGTHRIAYDLHQVHVLPKLPDIILYKLYIIEAQIQWYQMVVVCFHFRYQIIMVKKRCTEVRLRRNPAFFQIRPKSGFFSNPAEIRLFFKSGRIRI